MAAKSTDHKENIDECKYIFVSWKWFVGFLAGMIATIVSIAWAGGEIVTKNDEQHKNIDSRLLRIESEYAKLDTILFILRQP